MEIISTLIEAHIFRVEKNELQFLLLRRSDDEKVYPGLWQMVTGHIKPGEKAFETAIREIKEETDLTPDEFWTVPQVNSYYSPAGDLICMIPVFAAKVKNNSHVKISSEHSTYEWMNKEKAKELFAWKGQIKSI